MQSEVNPDGSRRICVNNRESCVSFDCIPVVNKSGT